MENTVTDKFGTWIVQKDGARRLIEEAPEWIAKQEELSTSVPPEPTKEDYLMDLDYRLSLIELNL